MFKKILFLFFGLIAICKSYAQSTNPIRDSLSVAMEQLAYHPDSIDLCLKKAGWNIQLQQWQYAQETYDRVLKRDPDNIAALYYRAYVNEKQGRYSFARMDYNNLLKIIPGNFEAQLGLALLNQKDHHYTEAMEQINRLVEQCRCIRGACRYRMRTEYARISRIRLCRSCKKRYRQYRLHP